MEYFLKYYGFLIAFMISIFTFSQAKVKDYIIEGNEYYAKGKFDNAEYAYKRAALEDPTSVKANYNLGNALYQQKRYQESITHFNKSAEIATTKAEKHSAFHNAGNAYLEEKEYDKAIESFKNALRNNPKDEATRYNLAYAKKMLEKNKQKDGNNSKDNSKSKDKENENKNEKNSDKNQQNNPQQNKDNSQEQNNKDEQSEKNNAGANPKNGGENGNQDGKGNQPNTEISQGSKGEDGAEKENAPKGVGDGMLKALQEQEARTQRRIIQQKTDQKKSKTAKDW